MDIADLSNLVTYAFQIILICFLPVPSAGSTLEMLFKRGKDSKISFNHLAKSAIQSVTRMMVIITATITVMVTAFVSLITIIFPPTATHLVLFVKATPNILTIMSVLLIIGSNMLTFVAVRTLRSHVTFHEFGDPPLAHRGDIPYHTKSRYRGFGCHFHWIFPGLTFCCHALWMYRISAQFGVSGKHGRNLSRPDIRSRICAM